MSQWTQIEELAKRATPRPLKVGTDGLLNRYILSADDEIVTYFPDTSKAHGKNGDDFAYLVLACNAAPDMARRLREAIAHCRQHEHPGVSPGYQQACADVRKILETTNTGG